jgi:hypothetical protein
MKDASHSFLFGTKRKLPSASHSQSRIKRGSNRPVSFERIAAGQSSSSAKRIASEDFGDVAFRPYKYSDNAASVKKAARLVILWTTSRTGVRLSGWSNQSAASQQAGIDALPPLTSKGHNCRVNVNSSRPLAR